MEKNNVTNVKIYTTMYSKNFLCTRPTPLKIENMTTMLYVECHPVFHMSVSVSQSSELSIAPPVASSADWLSFRPHVGSSPSSHHQWTLTVPTADKSTQPVPHPRWTLMKLSSAHQSAVSLVKLSHNDFAQFFNQLRQLIQSPLSTNIQNVIHTFARVICSGSEPGF